MANIPEQSREDFDIRTAVRLVHENVLPTIQFVRFWGVLQQLVRLLGVSLQWRMQSTHNITVYSPKSIRYTDFRLFTLVNSLALATFP